MFLPHVEVMPTAVGPTARHKRLVRRFAGLGQAGMEPGEALVGFKLDELLKDWRDLRTLPADTAGLKKCVARLRALEDDVTRYIGQPKADMINAKIEAAAKVHDTYAKAGQVSRSTARIAGRITEIRGVLQSPVKIVTPPPERPAEGTVPGVPAKERVNIKNIVVAAVIITGLGLVVSMFVKPKLHKALNMPPEGVYGCGYRRRRHRRR